MKHPTIPIALLALLAGALIAGCGDDDDGEEGNGEVAAEAPTKAEFIARADEICAAADEELGADARAQYPEGPPEGEDAARFAEEVLLPNLQGQHDDLAALTPPEGEEDAVADMLSKLQSGIDSIGEEPQDFVLSTELDPASAAAQALGLTACGQ